MNIFKILASGHGSISETNISAFLGYLLNPNEDHGMGNTFLQQILLEHYKKNKTSPSLKKLFDEKTQNIRDLSPGSGYMVDVFLEQGFEGIIEKTKNKLVKTIEGTKTIKTEIVDVLILIYKLDNSNSQDLAIQQLTRSKTLCNVVLIEVKSKKDSGRPGQLGNQIENSKTILNNLLEKDESSLIIKYKPEVVKELSMIYITPKGCKKYFDELGNKFLSNPKSHIYWSAKDNIEYLRNKQKTEIDIKEIKDLAIEKEYGYSVESIINKIINNDFDIKIERLPEYTNQTLQSFSNFIYADFTAKHKQKPGGDFTREVIKTLKELKLKYPEILKEHSWDILEDFDNYISEKYSNLGRDYSRKHIISIFESADSRRGTKFFSFDVSLKNIHLISSNHKVLQENIELLKSYSESFNYELSSKYWGLELRSKNYNIDNSIKIFEKVYSIISSAASNQNNLANSSIVN